MFYYPVTLTMVKTDATKVEGQTEHVTVTCFHKLFLDVFIYLFFFKVVLGNPLVPKSWSIHSYLTSVGWETLTNKNCWWYVCLLLLTAMLNKQPLFNFKKDLVAW